MTEYGLLLMKINNN